MDEGSKRRVSIRLLTQLRGVVLTTLAATLLTIGITATAVVQPIPAQAQVGMVTSSSFAAPAISRATRVRLAAWHFALRQRGKPYIWGGTGPAGFDCSGLVYAAYLYAGVRLPRTTYEMLASPLLIRIPKSQARRGDLAFFGTGHVELYDWGPWTFGAATVGTLIGFHRMNSFWHPTMYFRVRV